MQFNSIVEGFFQSAEAHAEKTAIIWKDKQVSYREASENVRKTAEFLKNKGVGQETGLLSMGIKIRFLPISI